MINNETVWFFENTSIIAFVVAMLLRIIDF
ncbi:MAG: hypothetical protein ACI9JK_001574 [Phycisphaerales bacterium]|jgi:hypothetical protein